MAEKTESIQVFGGGVLGMTVAMGLRVMGYRVTMISDHWADRWEGEPGNPRFASLYPAASIAPHKVRLANLREATEFAQHCYLHFLSSPRWGVRRGTHWDVSEQPMEAPAYVEAFQDLQHLPASGAGLPGCPRRLPGMDLYGWRYSGVFLDYPVYIHTLGQCLEAMGVLRETRKLHPDDLTNYAGSPWVNCLGVGALDLFEDDYPSQWVRGHLLYVSGPGLPVSGREGRTYSYNYQPSPDIYAAVAETGAGLYFYPRREAWVLGGSADPGAVGEGVEWPSPTGSDPVRQVGETSVPEPLLEVNREILRQMTGVDILDYPIRAVTGYRFARDLASAGARLEADQAEPERIFHAYGFGGGGVTLSWYAARQVVAWARERFHPDTDWAPSTELFRSLKALLLEPYPPPTVSPNSEYECRS